MLISVFILLPKKIKHLINHTIQSKLVKNYFIIYNKYENELKFRNQNIKKIP
jgi:hypothetical protein